MSDASYRFLAGLGCGAAAGVIAGVLLGVHVVRGPKDAPAPAAAAVPAPDPSGGPAVLAPPGGARPIPRPWSDRPLDAEARELARSLWLPTDAARFLADRQGRIPAPTQAALDEAGRRATALARRLGLAGQAANQLRGAFAQALVRQRMREASGPATTDAARMARATALRSIRATLGDDVARAAEPELATLPELPAPSVTSP